MTLSHGHAFAARYGDPCMCRALQYIADRWEETAAMIAPDVHLCMAMHRGSG